MKTMMQALVIEGSNQITVKEVPKPCPHGNEVLIKVKACGICGSDIPRALQDGAHFYPLILGHEFAGEVVAVGEEANDVPLGQRVTAAPLIPCGKCSACEAGLPAMCAAYSFLGSRQDGAMAEFVLVPKKNLIPLAEHVSFEAAATIEPLTVAIHGVEREGLLRSGTSAIILGCGTIGLMTLAVLKAKGIARVYAVDIDAKKLAIAKQMGAHAVLDSRTQDIKDFCQQQGGIDVVFETSGVPMLQALALELAAPRGKVVYIGTAHGEVKLAPQSFERILRHELMVTGSWMSFSAPFPGTEWRAAAEFLAEGKVQPELLITHRYSLTEGRKAFETLTDKNAGAIKVMFVEKARL